MSRPVESKPIGWVNDGPSLALNTKCLSGSGIGRRGANTAPNTSATSQTMAIQPKMPSFLVAARSTSTGGAVGAGSRMSGWTPAATVDWDAGLTRGSADGSGMADPWVEDGVEDVDEEVHGDVAERKDGDVALEGDVLTAEDGVSDEETHSVDGEDVLDHDRPTDERAD